MLKIDELSFYVKEVFFLTLERTNLLVFEFYQLILSSTTFIFEFQRVQLDGFDLDCSFESGYLASLDSQYLNLILKLVYSE